MITGFQAQGTLGRRLVDGAKRVRLFGEETAALVLTHRPQTDKGWTVSVPTPGQSVTL